MFYRVADYLAGIGVDKYIHFNACLFIAFGVSAVLSLWFNVNAATILGVVLSIGFGYIKELIDRKKKGDRFDFQDMKADVLGAIVGCLMSLI